MTLLRRCGLTALILSFGCGDATTDDAAEASSGETAGTTEGGADESAEGSGGTESGGESTPSPDAAELA